MRKCAVGIGVLLTLECSVSFVHGQKETERYIPLGQSPGLSDKYTVIGEVKAVDVPTQSLTVVGPSGTDTVTVTDRTRIWLDRSRLKLTTLKGRFADLKNGRTIEVKYEDRDRRPLAEWIKVQLTEPGGASEAVRELTASESPVHAPHRLPIQRQLLGNLGFRPPLDMEQSVHLSPAVLANHAHLSE